MGIGGGGEVGGEFFAEAWSAGAEAAAGGEEVVVIDRIGISPLRRIPGQDDGSTVVVFVGLVGRRLRRCASELRRSVAVDSRAAVVVAGDDPVVVAGGVGGGMGVGGGGEVGGELFAERRPAGAEAAARGEEVVVIDRIGSSTLRRIPAEDDGSTVVEFVHLVGRSLRWNLIGVIGALRVREPRPCDYRQQYDGREQPPRSATGTATLRTNHGTEDWSCLAADARGQIAHLDILTCVR